MRESMDMSLKLEYGDRNKDRISSLPDEVLRRIFSFLPTKDAVVMSVTSRKMRHVFCRTSTLDFDDSPIYHCLDPGPRLIERFPTFITFVDGVLQAITIACQSTDQHHLTRFSLRFGGNYTTRMLFRSHHSCKQGCFPDLNPSYLYAWITFPLARRVRELDLCIHVRNPVKLPSAIFTCETLEVLKLDVGLDIDQELSIFSLPNLKVFHLYSAFIHDDDFLNRLVSSCPSLEELTLQCCSWTNGDFISISSPSLRRLVLDLTFRAGDYDNCSERVLIDTPNLLYFEYNDNIAHEYSVTNMNAIVKARLTLVDMHMVASFQSMLSLMRMLSNVQHLILRESCLEALDLGALKDQLPVFHNLKYLELGYYFSLKWDQVVVEFLNCSPFLEILAFPKGLSGENFPSISRDKLALELEPECWRATRAIPPCCRSHLKKIMIKLFWNSERELDLVKFLLRSALILEELVIYLQPSRSCQAEDEVTSLESTLKKIPRASIACSIRVQSVGTEFAYGFTDLIQN